MLQMEYWQSKHRNRLIFTEKHTDRNRRRGKMFRTLGHVHRYGIVVETWREEKTSVIRCRYGGNGERRHTDRA